jgi:hypothetical protein
LLVSGHHLKTKSVSHFLAIGPGLKILGPVWRIWAAQRSVTKFKVVIAMTFVALKDWVFL